MKGFMRRIIAIECPHTFVSDPNSAYFEDGELPYKLDSDEARNALLLMALSGLNRCMPRRKFTQTKKTEALMETYKKKSDSAYAFAREFIEPDQYGKGIHRPEAFRMYSCYCDQEGLARKPKSELFALLGKMGALDSNSRVFKGLKCTFKASA